MSALVPNQNDIRIAMLGMVDGNGHPYSWSAIFNGYDREAMKACPFPANETKLPHSARTCTDANAPA